MKFVMDHRMQQAAANCFSVAGERFKENAAIFDQVAKTGGNGMFTPDAAKQVADSFRDQAAQARAFSQLFINITDTVTLEYEQDVEDDENPFHPESPEGRDWQRQFDKLAK